MTENKKPGKESTTERRESWTILANCLIKASENMFIMPSRSTGKDVTENSGIVSESVFSLIQLEWSQFHVEKENKPLLVIK